MKSPAATPKTEIAPARSKADTDSFGRYMKEILIPSLKSGQIVLMDNLSVHTSGWVRDLVEGKGCQLCGFFLPTRPT